MDDVRIRQLIGDEMAQNDPHFAHYAVARDELLSTLADSDRRYVIINAPRGSGKSGLLLMHEEAIRLASPSTHVVLRRTRKHVHYPEQVSGFDGAVRFWSRQFLEWLVEEIGAAIGIPKTEDDLVAVQFAERAGRRAAPSNAPGGQAAVPNFVLQRIVEYCGRRFWLMLDEMDMGFEDTPYTANKLAALLEAAKTSLDISNLSLRVTIRPHIMTLLRTRYDGIQQLRAYEMTLSWSPNQLRLMLAQRIRYFDEIDLAGRRDFFLEAPSLEQQGGPSLTIQRHFDDFDMSFAPGRSSRFRALHTVSLGRPRWMLEFCALALSFAKKDRATHVEFRKAMYVFGNNRIQFLAGEHHYHAPQLEAFMNGIAGARTIRFASASKLRQAIEEHVLLVAPASHRAPGDPVSEQALQVARLLYMVEFLRARQGNRKDYRFIGFVDQPRLLASWNTEPNIVWELHPTFQLALNIEDNHAYRVGDEIRLFGERAPEDIEAA